MIEVAECRFPASIQDAGRPGFRHLGVPLSGALAPDWLALANGLAGNDLTAAAIEVRLLGPTLRAKSRCLVALAGEFMARIEDGTGQSRPAANWIPIAGAWYTRRHTPRHAGANCGWPPSFGSP